MAETTSTKPGSSGENSSHLLGYIHIAQKQGPTLMCPEQDQECFKNYMYVYARKNASLSARFSTGYNKITVKSSMHREGVSELFSWMTFWNNLGKLIAIIPYLTYYSNYLGARITYFTICDIQWTTIIHFFRCKNIFVRRKSMKIIFTNIIIQLKFFE